VTQDMSNPLDKLHSSIDEIQKQLHHVFGHHHEQQPTFTQTNLVSDGSVSAKHTDSNLINPWGVSFGPSGPLWVSDNGTGVTTIYDGDGNPQTIAGNTAITIAPPMGQTGPAAPTGQVFNNTGGGFDISQYGNSASSVFLFATEDGTISGWNPSVNPGSSVLAVDDSGDSAVFKGLAIGTDDYGNSHLYAADFHNNAVDIFDKDFNQVGSFTDPNLPDGYAPFNVQNLDGKLFVTFAQQNEDKHDDVAGPGHGFVDEFDLKGNLITHIASGGSPDSPLNSPWGLDIAPPSFGKLAGNLLVGNFGDGTINVYDLKNNQFDGKLLGTDGKPIQIGDLWALTNGGGGKGGDPNSVFFTAGVENEAHGLFGSLSPSDTMSSPDTTMTTSYPSQG